MSISTISDFVDVLETHHNRPALLFKTGFRTEVWTYGKLHKTILKMLTFLTGHGLKKGDRIIVYAPNSPWWACLYLACTFAGIIVVPLDFNSNLSFVKKVAAITKPKMLFTVKTTQSAGINTVYMEDLPDKVLQLHCRKFSDTSARDDVIELVFTSGTTGNPKGVVLTQYNLVSNINAIRQIIHLPPHTVFLSTLPLSHMLEQTLGLLGPLRFGCSVIYLQTKSSLAIMDTMRQHRVSTIVTVPAFLKLLRDAILRKVKRQGKAATFSRAFAAAEHLPFSLRKMLFRRVHAQFGGKFNAFFVGGAPLDPSLQRFWERLGIHVLQGYGLTEASPVISCNTFSHQKLGSVGRPLHNVRIILGDHNEIMVQGPNVTKGYYQDAEANHEAFEQGWFRTGDIGEFDDDGYLYIKGRKKSMMVNSSGQKVYPEDLEGVLNSLDGVRDSCAVQVGERIMAAVLPYRERKLHPTNILHAANAILSAPQQISSLVIWPDADFPRTPTFKIIRSKVTEHLSLPAVPCQEPDDDPLIQILKKVSGKEVIEPHAQLSKDLNLSSLDRVELLALIVEEFGVDLEESALIETTTVSGLRKSIETNTAELKRLPFSQWALYRLIITARIPLQRALFFIMRRFVSITYAGRENLVNLPLPVIFMSNHTSHFDTVAILSGMPGKLRRKVAVAAAMDYFFGTANPLKRFSSMFVALFVNAYPFSRDKAHFIRESFVYTGVLLDKGFSILIFPEGHRHPTGKMEPLKTGAGLLALQMHASVVPVKVEGFDTVLPKGAWFPKPGGRGKVTFGRPIAVDAKGSYIEATKQVEQAIKKL